MSKPRLMPLVLIVLLLSPTLPAAAQTLRAAVESAWRVAPETAPEASGQAAAAARQSAAGSWLAAAPSLTLGERSDRFDADRGRRTQEVELSLPLWRWGQRSARSALADAELALADAELAAARWRVAGEVREAAWSAALDASEAAFVAQRRDVIERLGREVARHVEVGDMARADWLLVNGEQLAAQAAEVAAQARAQAALQRYRVLIGRLDAALPNDLQVQPPASEVAPANSAHPLLQHADALRQRASRAGEDVAQNLNEGLELSLGVEREREADGQSAESSLRLALKIPFGGGRWNRPAAAAANAESQRAELNEIALRRALAADLANAQAARQAAEAALALAGQRVQAAREHALLLRKGFALGETGLAVMLRAEGLLLDAQADAAKQELLLGQAHSRLQHSLGILP